MGITKFHLNISAI